MSATRQKAPKPTRFQRMKTRHTPSSPLRVMIVTLLAFGVLIAGLIVGTHIERNLQRIERTPHAGN